MCTTDSTGFSAYACDLWAAGVCLYIFATGTLPFFSLLPSDLFEMIAKADINYEGLGLSDELVDILSLTLEKDPSRRAGVGDCLQHRFCADARDERVQKLGNRFEESKEHIILSKIDVDMALSITVADQDELRLLSKTFSAPASSFTAQDAEDIATKVAKPESMMDTVAESSEDGPPTNLNEAESAKNEAATQTSAATKSNTLKRKPSVFRRSMLKLKVAKWLDRG